MKSTAKIKSIFMGLGAIAGVVAISASLCAQNPDLTQYKPMAEVDSVEYDFVDYGDVNNVDGVIDASDYPRYLKEAKNGDDESMRLVALCHLTGTGVEKDFNEAWKWFGKAIKAGNATAEYDVGTLYRDGYGVAQSFEESAYWFRKAAANGNIRAMVAMGDQFLKGDGVQQDNRIAAEYYWRAAERGDKEGAYKYAGMLRDGRGVKKDLAKARKWFEAASGWHPDKFVLKINTL